MADSQKEWPIPRNQKEESATSKSPLLAVKAVYMFIFSINAAFFSHSCNTFKLGSFEFLEASDHQDVLGETTSRLLACLF